MLTVPRAGRMLLTQFVIAPEGHVHERLPEDLPCRKLLIFGLEGELFFGAVAAMEKHLEAIEARLKPDTRVIVLRLKRVRNPDAVAVAELDHFLARMKARGVHVLMCGVTQGLYGVMERVGLLERVGEQIFLEQRVRQTSTMRAIRHAYTLLDDRCERCPWRDEALAD
jgi:SulP family sulfate permease